MTSDMRDEIEHRRAMYPEDQERRLNRIVFNTSTSNELADRTCRSVDEFRVDARKEDRLKKQECRSCFYLRSYRVSVGLTTINCKACDKKMISSDSPDVCGDCSNRYKICRLCGGDLDGRENRRTLEPKGR